MHSVKKIISFTAIIFLFAIFCFAPKTSIVSATDGEPVYEREYASEIVLPMLYLEDGQSYKVSVYAKSDVDFENPLRVEQFSFKPENIGEYVIRYVINDNGLENEKLAKLIVKDTVDPTFTLQLKQNYAIGDTVSLFPSIVDATSAHADVTYLLLRDDVNLTSEITDDTFTIKQAGFYKLRVKVTDAGGNEKAEIFYFKVSGESGGCGSSVSASISSCSIILLGGITLGAVLIKRIRKNNRLANKKGDNNE